MEKRYLTPNDVAEYTSLSRRTVYLWAERGKLPCSKLGKILRFDRIEVDEFMKSFKMNAAGSGGNNY